MSESIYAIEYIVDGVSDWRPIKYFKNELKAKQVFNMFDRSNNPGRYRINLIEVNTEEISLEEYRKIPR
jgi:hypothetical protein